MARARTHRTVSINRAPVLTLWAAVVAERLGFDRDEALTLGRAMAGLNAQRKGRAIGVYKPRARTEAERKRRQMKSGDVHLVDLLGTQIPVAVTKEGVRAVQRNRPTAPEGVERYLESKFGDSLDAVRDAMTKLAKAYPQEQLAAEAINLYQEFRPNIPRGVRGWGASGSLDIDRIVAMAKER
jgi:hypothetical protein